MMTMKRLFNFSYRFVNIRYASTNTQRMGLPFKIDENQALTYFNRWRKSLWYRIQINFVFFVVNYPIFIYFLFSLRG